MEQKQKGTKGRRGERGAIIVEATISLSIFMFTMFTLLYVIQMAYAQSRVSVALDCAAKTIAEYAHVYFATGLDESFSGEGGKSSELMGKVAEFLETVGGELGSLDGELGQFVTSAGNAADGDSIADLLKNESGQLLAKQLMEKNLVSGTGQSTEDFMMQYHISDFSLKGSRILEKGENEFDTDGNAIFLHATYTMEVIKLLNVDVEFQMSTWAYTTAWMGK